MTSLTEIRANVQAAIWQAVAKSGVDVSAIPQSDMDTLVGTITDNVLRSVDGMIGEAAATQEVAVESVEDNNDDDDEILLWEGRPFLSFGVKYQITSERVRIMEGVFSRERRDIELVRIQDMDHKQNLTERTFNMGDVFIRGNDQSDPEIVLNNITDPNAVHEILRKAVLKARKKYNISYREEM